MDEAKEGEDDSLTPNTYNNIRQGKGLPPPPCLEFSI
jgi:hypothetical protein